MQQFNDYLRSSSYSKRPFSLALPVVCVIALFVLLTADPMPVSHAAVTAKPLRLFAVSAQPLHTTELVAPMPTETTIAPPPNGGVPAISGQLILVSESQQWLWVYQNRQLIYSSPVTTGRPGLTTPTGLYHVLSKAANLTFYSPWPPGSPFYYTPEHINYALYFHDTGFYIHDAPWRSEFGFGSNTAHVTPTGTPETGSHGCVNVPTSTGAWLYQWVAIGATIDIVG